MAKAQKKGMFGGGPLGTPERIVFRTLLDDGNELMQEAVVRVYEKLPALAAWFGVAENANGQIDWRTVCLRMAWELGVPGFQIEVEPPKGRGAPRKWDGLADFELISDVSKVLFRRQKGVRDAMVQVQKSVRWKNFKVTSLEARYREAVKRSGEDWKAAMYRALIELRPNLAELLAEPESSRVNKK